MAAAAPASAHIAAQAGNRNAASRSKSAASAQAPSEPADARVDVAIVAMAASAWATSCGVRRRPTGVACSASQGADDDDPVSQRARDSREIARADSRTVSRRASSHGGIRQQRMTLRQHVACALPRPTSCSRHTRRATAVGRLRRAERQIAPYGAVELGFEPEMPAVRATRSAAERRPSPAASIGTDQALDAADGGSAAC